MISIRNARENEIDVVLELWKVGQHAMGYTLLDGVGRYIKDLSL